MATATKAALTAHDEFSSLHAETRDSLIDLAFRWAEGELSAATFAEKMDGLLLDAHTAAVVIGRTHAGDAAPEDEDDRRFASRIVQEEHNYLQGFADQMQAGVYNDEGGVRDAERVAARAADYGGRLTGTANQAWTLTLPQETEIWWRLGADDDSTCDACPEIADGSPYPADSMDLWPGSNQTPCRQNCRCRIETESGQRGFVTP